MSDTTGQVDADYEFLGGKLAERYVDRYHADLKRAGLEGVAAFNKVALNREGFVINTTPLSIIFGWDYMCDELGRRCPSLARAVAITHNDFNRTVHGKESEFNGVYADVGLLVRPYAHGETSNAQMTIDLRSRLGLISSGTQYDATQGKDIDILVDNEKECDRISSLNNIGDNIGLVRNVNAPLGVRYYFKHPERVPRNKLFRDCVIFTFGTPFALFSPEGEYDLPQKFLEQGTAEESLRAPRSNGIMRIYIRGPEGIVLGGPNLEKSTDEGRLLVVKGERDVHY